MSRKAFPAYCPGQEWSGSSIEDARLHYESKGFQCFDSDDGWITMRNGIFEAYIRRNNHVEWIGSVVQLEAA